MNLEKLKLKEAVGKISDKVVDKIEDSKVMEKISEKIENGDVNNVIEKVAGETEKLIPVTVDAIEGAIVSGINQTVDSMLTNVIWILIMLIVCGTASYFVFRYLQGPQQK